MIYYLNKPLPGSCIIQIIVHCRLNAATTRQTTIFKSFSPPLARVEGWQTYMYLNGILSIQWLSPIQVSVPPKPQKEEFGLRLTLKGKGMGYSLPWSRRIILEGNYVTTFLCKSWLYHINNYQLQESLVHIQGVRAKLDSGKVLLWACFETSRAPEDLYVTPRVGANYF